MAKQMIRGGGTIIEDDYMLAEGALIHLEKECSRIVRNRYRRAYELRGER